MRWLLGFAIILVALQFAGAASYGGDPNYCTNCVINCANLYPNNPEYAESCVNYCVQWCAYCTSKASCNQCPGGGAYRCAWSDAYGCLPCPGATCISDCGYVPYTPTPAPATTHTPAPQSVCDRHQISCQNCTYYEGCGWSSRQGRCLSGRSSGSIDGTSSGSDWKWYTRDCTGAGPTPTPARTPATCSNYNSCATCTPNYGCGWSKAKQKCLAGDENHSYDGMSSESDWVWLSANCTATAPTPSQADCSGKSSCEGCTDLAGCGWSLSQTRCLTGNATNSNDGSSRDMDWVWYKGSCPAQCPTHPNCLNCTYYGECGWSRQQSKCLYGNGSRSYDGSSSGSDWLWMNSSCPGYSPTPRPSATRTPVRTPTPAQAACGSYSSCYDCAQHSGCGWSKAKQRCLSGTSSGSSDGSSSGSDWAWDAGQCVGGGETCCYFFFIPLAGGALAVIIYARRD